MRWRVAKVLRSTCVAKTAISSSSSRANNGTCFSMSRLHAMANLVRPEWGLLNLIIESHEAVEQQNSKIRSSGLQTTRAWPQRPHPQKDSCGESIHHHR